MPKRKIKVKEWKWLIISLTAATKGRGLLEVARWSTGSKGAKWTYELLELTPGSRRFPGWDGLTIGSVHVFSRHKNKPDGYLRWDRKEYPRTWPEGGPPMRARQSISPSSN